MFIEIFVIVFILIAIAIIGLSISILIKKGGQFPNTHIGKDKNMKKKGISCARTTDREERKNYKPIKIENDSE